MKSIRITIATEPTAKGRPRTTFTSGGKFRTYTPTKTVKAEEFIRERLLRHKQDAFPAHTPVRLSITFFRTKSKYLPLREKMPFRKPDIVNFATLACDAMTKILYDDDAQITTLNLRKRWSPTGKGYITLKMEVDNDNI